jgi:transposase-like protein
MKRRDGSAKRDAKRAVSADKQRIALEMRVAGAKQEAIAEAMGVPRSTVQFWIQRALAAIPAPAAESLRKLHMERTEHYLLHIDAPIRKGDASSVRAAIRVLDHEARLMGLYAPTKVTGADGGPLSVKIGGIEVTTLTDEQLSELTAHRWPKGIEPAAGPAAGAGRSGGAGAPAPDASADAPGPAADPGRTSGD